MVFYSEDNCTQVSSILLSKLLNIEFLSSNTNLGSIIENENNFIAYLDVVPNNSKLNILYNEYKSSIIEKYNNSEFNKYIVPIPCIEYFIIKAILQLGLDFKFKYKWLDIVLFCVINKVIIDRPYPPKSIGYKGDIRSFERQCKLVLNNSDEMFMNFDTSSSKNSTNLLGTTWYLNDSKDLSIIDKATQIARNLPIVIFKDIIPRGFIVIDNLSKTVQDLQDEYNKWLSNPSKIKLPDKWWEEENIEKTLNKLRKSFG